MSRVCPMVCVSARLSPLLCVFHLLRFVCVQDDAEMGDAWRQAEVEALFSGGGVLGSPSVLRPIVGVS